MKFSLKGKSATFAKLEQALKSTAEQNLKTQTTSFVKDLKLATPIDTGEAREAWVAEKTFTGYTVSNDKPYIGRLNQGSSKQAPAHFIEASALKFGEPQGVIVESVK